MWTTRWITPIFLIQNVYFANDFFCRKKRYSNAKFDKYRLFFAQSIGVFFIAFIIKTMRKSYSRNEVKIMIELSSLLFKPVIERDTSNVVGRIKNAYFSHSCNCIAYFVVSSCKQGCDALLPIEDILCFSDAIIVQNDANVRCVDDVDFTPFSSGVIGMDVYTQNGILKGQIQKVEFSKNGKVGKLCTETDQFTPQNVASVGDVILLKTAKQGKAKKPTIPRPEQETKVFALDSSKNRFERTQTQKSAIQPPESPTSFPIPRAYAPSEPTQSPSASVQSTSCANPSERVTPIQIANTQINPEIAQSAQFAPIPITTAPSAIKTSDDAPLFSSNALKVLDAPQDEDDCHTPSRIISDYTFLLGRVLSSDLTTFAGALLAKAGTTIDDALVEKSRLNGKLVDLVLLAKSN